MLEEKDRDVQSQQDSRKTETKDEKNESVSVSTDMRKRKPGCNRKKCYCAQ